LQSFVRSQQTFIPLIFIQVAWPRISIARFLFAFLIFLRVLLILLLLLLTLNQSSLLLLVLLQLWLEVLQLLQVEL
jgi:hypothetical protein